MTTDELLSKLPSHIGNHKENGFYVLGENPNDDIQYLYLHNDGKYWCASYGIEGEFLCMNPDAEPPYDTAFAFARTQNEALQGLYDWCVKHNFIKGE